MPSKKLAPRATNPRRRARQASGEGGARPPEADDALGGGPRQVGRATPGRRIITGRRDCITGLSPSGKRAMGYRMVAYEGRLADDVILLLEDDPEVVSYQEEPEPFAWFDPRTGRGARYTPDFRVEYADGRRLCLEVRPRALLRELASVEVLRERTAGALAAGYDAYEVRTERDVDPVRLANAALVASERRFFADEAALHAARVAVARLGGVASIGDLRRATGLATGAFRAVIGLIARGELVPRDRSRPLDDRMVVARPVEPGGGGAP